MKENSYLQRDLGIIFCKIHKSEPLIAFPLKKIIIMPYLASFRAIIIVGFVYYEEGCRYGVPFSNKQKKAHIMRNLDEVSFLISILIVCWSNINQIGPLNSVILNLSLNSRCPKNIQQQK